MHESAGMAAALDANVACL